MPEYTTRKGKTFYLHVGKTKTGKPKYYFALNNHDTLAAAIPDGFEIHESPNGQVTLRKILPKLISDEELATVKRELCRIPRLKHSQVDRNLKVVTIYVADSREETLDDILALTGWRSKINIEQLASKMRFYQPELKFVLMDEKKRLFQAQRYCYLGAIDDWIDIGTPGSLASLANRYIKHLGRESYFELI